MKRFTLCLALAAAATLSACGKNEPATDAPAASSPAPAPAPEATPQAAAPAPAAPAATTSTPPPATATGASAVTATGPGADTYAKSCAACHAAGVTGAPKPGDKADWGPRIAQGKETLYTHALQGYTGKKGVMPPKGGFANLSDDEVKAAVDYMVATSS
ncbi:MAG: cytochrome c5 family protein [Comamonadaceae bacterium]|nr:MAG: cytochrome c5 family protein [Comamonadaceae bacterium]